MFPLHTKILFCDDMKIIREAVRRCLKELGYHNYSEFVDGNEAWDAVLAASETDEPYQLIISDWNMPIMQGIDFLRLVRANPKMKDMPFFLLTAENEVSQILEAKKLGVTDYILKPFSVVNVQQKLMMAYLRMKKSQRQAS